MIGLHFSKPGKLAGKYPAILTDPIVGNEASKLFEDALGLLDELITKKLLTAKAVIGIFPAHSSGDDIILYEDESCAVEKLRLHHLRQQIKNSGSS